MKILAFTDVHASVAAFKKIQANIKKYKPDYLFCLGDVTIFEQNIKQVLEKINSLGVKTLIIHGNHEMGPVMAKLCKKYKNLEYVHKKIVDLGDYIVLAHGGGGFYGPDYSDKDFDKFVRKNLKKLKKPTILLTHAPPYKTKLDYLDWVGDYVGCESYTDYIYEMKPILALAGHLHENFGKKQKIGKTLVCNPGPRGKVFRMKKANVSLLN